MPNRRADGRSAPPRRNPFLAQFLIGDLTHKRPSDWRPLTWQERQDLKNLPKYREYLRKRLEDILKMPPELQRLMMRAYGRPEQEA